MDGKIKLFSNKKITKMIKFFSVLLLWGFSLKEIIVFNFFPLENIGKTIFSLFEIFIVFAILLVCSHVIFRIEEYFSEREKILNFNSILFSVFITIPFISFYNPLDKKRLEVISFSRVFGRGFINDWDVARLINNFTVFIFLFAIVFLCGILFENYWENRINISKDVKEFLVKILAILDSIIVMNAFYYFRNGGTNFNYTLSILALLVVYVVIFTLLKLNSQIDFDKYIAIFCCILGTSFPIAIVLFRNFRDGKIFLMISILLCVAIIGFLVLKQHRKLPIQKIFEKNYDTTFLLCGLFPLITSFYIEFLNILNQYSVFVGHPRKYYAIGIFCLFLIALCVDLLKKKKFLNSISLKKWIYIELLLGFAFLSINIPLQNIYGADIFESANSSILISDFLHFGKIPIVEHYGGHMLANVLGGIVYGVLNQDFLGTIFTPYNLDYIFFAVILYFFLKECFDEDTAFFSSLFFSFSLFNYFGVALLGIVMFLVYVKNNSCKNAILYWLASILCCIYRLDLGFTVVIPLVFCSAFYAFSMRKKEIAKQQVIGLGVNCIFWCILWCVLCIAKNINPVIRLIEFLKISASNQNWAYATIGDSNRIVFGLFYFVIPLFMIFCLIHTIVSSKDKFNLNQKIILLFLGLSYFTNFSRGLVRHSLAESAFWQIEWCCFLFFAVYISFLSRHRLFFILIVAFSLLNSIFINGYLGSWSSLADTATNRVKLTEHWIGKGNGNEKINRCLFNDALKKQTKPIKNIMDFLLEDDETYLDFENHSFLYSAIGRKNPVYVAQSPGHLSGEFTQIQFVAEAKKAADKIPLCLMPAGKDCWLNFSFDGIMNNIRYYKVADYIYQNYRPLCLADETHAVWVRNDKYDEFYEKLGFKNYIDSEFSPFDFSEASKRNLNFACNNMYAEFLGNEKNTVLKLISIGGDPFVSNFRLLLNESDVFKTDEDIFVQIKFTYDSNVAGVMQLFYTTEEAEGYSEEKSIRKNISRNGEVLFEIPLTKFSQVRLDLPEESSVEIFDLKVREIEEPSGIKKIDYGYDADFHNYNMALFPYIWGQFDKKHASKNTVLASAKKTSDNIYFIDGVESIDKTTGNYILIHAESSENNFMSLNVGNGSEQLCNFNVSLKEGAFDYLIRISSDYNWYLNKLDTFEFNFSDVSKINSEKIKINILQGD